MENLAARRALTSTGIIGLSALLLTKVAKIDLKVSLPIGMAAGLSVDYLTNLDEYRKAIRIFSGRLKEHEKRGTSDPYMNSVMTAILAILALNNASIVTGAYRELFELGDGDPPGGGGGGGGGGDDDEGGPPPPPGGLMHYGALFARRSWNCVSRVQIIETMTALCSRIVGSVGSSITTAVTSGALYPRAPASPDEAEQFRQMQSNMQHVAEQVVETAQTQVAHQVRDELDEKMPENAVATIIPPERSEDIDAFLQGLPDIPERRTRAAIISVGGRLAAILMDPPGTTGMSQGSVSEIPLIHLMPGHSIEEQLARLAGQESDSETSSVFYVPGTSQQAIEAGETEAQRLLQSEREIEALRNTMWTLYNVMKSFPEGDPRIASVQEQINDLEQQHIAKHPEGEGYLDTVQQAWEMEHPG